MKLVFADASFWIALRNPRDQFHKTAAGLARRLLEERVRLVLTPLVFAEVHAQFCRARISRERVIRDCWNNPVVQMEQVSVADQVQALEILQKHTDKTYSFCDAVSFAVMLRLELQAALSFDEHFRQFGRFKVIDDFDL
jgi:uncharacterized protein